MNAPDATPNCQCTTCRYKHAESTRVDVPSRKDPAIRHSCCPKCGGKNYFSLNAQGKKRKFGEAV